MMTPVEVAREIAPVLAGHADEIDRTASFPVAAMRAMRDSGLLGALVPAQFGGMGGGLGDMVEVCMVLAGECLSSAQIWAMHCQQTDVLVRHASPPLAASLLPRIAAGEVYLGSITTDAGTGGQLLRSSEPMEIVAEDLLLDRHAPVVTGGRHADGYLITMATASSQVSLVYAERDQLDITELKPWDPLGMRGTHSPALHLRGSVPAGQMIGEPGGFRAIAVDSMIPAGHLGWAACWLGTAHRALADVVALLRSRDRPNRIDPRSDLFAERLARIRISVELVGSYLFRVRDEILGHREACRSVDEPAVQIHLNNLKVASAELCFDVVDRLIGLVGMGTGYLRGARIPLERHFRDLRSASLNNADDRLLVMSGNLALLDRSVLLP